MQSNFSTSILKSLLWSLSSDDDSWRLFELQGNDKKIYILLLVLDRSRVKSPVYFFTHKRLFVVYITRCWTLNTPPPNLIIEKKLIYSSSSILHFPPSVDFIINSLFPQVNDCIVRLIKIINKYFKLAFLSRSKANHWTYLFDAGGEYDADLFRGTSRCFSVLSSEWDLMKINTMFIHWWLFM